MYAVFLAEIQAPEFFSGPFYIGRDVEVGQVEVLVQQGRGVFRLLLSQIFGPHFPGAEVGLEGLFQTLVGALGPFVKDQDKANHRSQQQENDGRHMEQLGQDVHRETYRQGIAQDSDGDERGVVGTVAGPQGVEHLGAAALLDRDGTEEGGQGRQQDDRCDHIAPDTRNEFGYQRIQEVDADDADGHGHDAVDEDHPENLL